MIALLLELQRSNQTTMEKSYYVDVHRSVQRLCQTFRGNVPQQLTMILAGRRVGLKSFGGEWPHGVKAVEREGLLYFQHKRAACKDSRSAFMNMRL